MTNLNLRSPEEQKKRLELELQFNKLWQKTIKLTKKEDIELFKLSINLLLDSVENVIQIRKSPEYKYILLQIDSLAYLYNQFLWDTYKD
jgi:hypothetical protein